MLLYKLWYILILHNTLTHPDIYYDIRYVCHERSVRGKLVSHRVIVHWKLYRRISQNVFSLETLK